MERLMKWLSEVFAPKAREVFANPWIDTVASTMKKVLPREYPKVCVNLQTDVR